MTNVQITVPSGTEAWTWPRSPDQRHQSISAPARRIQRPPHPAPVRLPLQHAAFGGSEALHAESYWEREPTSTDILLTHLMAAAVLAAAAGCARKPPVEEAKAFLDEARPSSSSSASREGAPPGYKPPTSRTTLRFGARANHADRCRRGTGQKIEALRTDQASGRTRASG